MRDQQNSERERERAILAQVLHLCLGVLFRPLCAGDEAES